jgi:hypothetical protein
VSASRRRAPLSWFERLRAAVEEWAPGRPWLPRLVLLLWCVWTGIRFARDRSAGSILDFLTLGIHEGGHLLFSPLGKFLRVAGGTIAQVAAPVAGIAVLLRQRDWFGPAFCGVWLATSLYGVSVYMADARAQELPLVTVGGGDVDDPDWTYLLDRVGLLEHDQGLAKMVAALAFVVMWTSIAYGGWVVWTIREHAESRRDR